MAEIPFLNTNFNVEQSSPTFFDPKAGLKAIENEAKKDLEKIDLFKEAKDKFYESRDLANKAKGNKIILQMADKVRYDKQKTLMNPQNTLGFTEIWDNVSTPTINEFKSQYLKNFRYEDRDAALETFNKAVNTIKESDNNDNYNRTLKENSAFIAGELSLAISNSDKYKDNPILLDAANKKITELERVLTNTMGETVAKDLVSNARLDNKKTNIQKLILDAETKKITYSELQEKLTEISGEDLTSSDKQKLDSFIVSQTAAYDKSFVRKQEQAIDIINQAWMDDDVAFNAQTITALTEGMPNYLKEKVDTYILRSAQAEAATELKSFKKNTVTNVLDYYKKLLNGEANKPDELFEIAGKNDDAQGLANYLYLKASKQRLKDGDIIGYEGGFGKDYQLTDSIYTEDFVTTLINIFESGVFVNPKTIENFQLKKYKAFDNWIKNNPNATNKDYEKFKEEELGFYYEQKVNKVDRKIEINNGSGSIPSDKEMDAILNSLGQ